MVDGSIVGGLVRAEIQSNNHFAADRFRIQVVRQLAPLMAGLLPDQVITLSIGVDGFWREVLAGQADSISFDPVRGLLDIEGRDLSARLVDAQTSETFTNRTASEIASVLAGRHGLGAAVDPTFTPIGRYYQAEHDRLSLGHLAKTTTEWDLLASLAAQEGYDVFMDGSTLNFVTPRPSAVFDLLVSDCLDMRLHRWVAMARPAQVTVQSWNSGTAQAVSVISESAGFGTAYRRSITRPNLQVDDAQRLADRIISDFRRHEWTVEVTMPGELDITARSQIVLSGTGSDWDRPYAVSQLTRHLDERRGFTQHLSLQGIG